MELQAIFVGGEVILYVSEDPDDTFVYAFDESTWRAIILGFANSWGDVLNSYDTLIDHQSIHFHLPFKKPPPDEESYPCSKCANYF